MTTPPPPSAPSEPEGAGGPTPRRDPPKTQGQSSAEALGFGGAATGGTIMPPVVPPREPKKAFPQGPNDPSGQSPSNSPAGTAPAAPVRITVPLSAPAPAASIGARTDSARRDAPAPPPATAPMIRIPGGTFLYGETKRQEQVVAFEIDRDPVTNRDYEPFVRATGHRPPLYWRDGACPPELLFHPVVGVDYFDAMAYARWAGKDLPYEDEWERAARGVDGRTYPWGDDADTAANTARAAIKMTLPVGFYPRNESPDGCRDTVGNTWELTHSPAPGGGVVVRGGSWYDFALYAKTFFRFASRPEARNGTIGFRCVRRAAPRSGVPRAVPEAELDRAIAARRGKGDPVDLVTLSPERRDLVPDLRRLKQLVALRDEELAGAPSPAKPPVRKAFAPPATVAPFNPLATGPTSPAQASPVPPKPAPVPARPPATVPVPIAAKAPPPPVAAPPPTRPAVLPAPVPAPAPIAAKAPPPSVAAPPPTRPVVFPAPVPAPAPAPAPIAAKAPPPSVAVPTPTRPVVLPVPVPVPAAVPAPIAAKAPPPPVAAPAQTKPVSIPAPAPAPVAAKPAAPSVPAPAPAPAPIPSRPKPTFTAAPGAVTAAGEAAARDETLREREREERETVGAGAHEQPPPLRLALVIMGFLAASVLVVVAILHASGSSGPGAVASPEEIARRYGIPAAMSSVGDAAELVVVEADPAGGIPAELRSGSALLVFAKAGYAAGNETIANAVDLHRRLRGRDVRVVLVVPRDWSVDAKGAVHVEGVTGDISVLPDPGALRTTGLLVPDEPTAVLLEGGVETLRVSSPEAGAPLLLSHLAPLVQDALIRHPAAPTPPAPMED